MLKALGKSVNLPRAFSTSFNDLGVTRFLSFLHLLLPTICTRMLQGDIAFSSLPFVFLCLQRPDGETVTVLSSKDINSALFIVGNVGVDVTKNSSLPF